MARKNLAIALSTFLFAANVSALDAPAALVPAGLTPGDTFFIVFQSSTTITDCAQTAATINAFGATAAGLGTDTSTIAGWTTLYAHQDGTNTTAAAQAFGSVVDRPIYLVNGTKVADDRADMFDGTLDNAIGVNESGSSGGLFDFSYTGFDATGAPVSVINNPTAGVGGCNIGANNTVNTTWANAAHSTVNQHMYVRSPLLTVAAAVSGNVAAGDW